MIWPFKKRRTKPQSAEIRQAEAAWNRADEVDTQVSARTSEVDVYYARLRNRRLENNFGDALVIAMARR